MKDYTPEELEVIRQRQMQCEHSFIRHLSDTTHRCTKCGVSQADWELMAPPKITWTPPPGSFPWGGIP